MTLRDDYEHWARGFARRMGEGWGVFLDRLYAKNTSGVTWDDVRVPMDIVKLGASAPTWGTLGTGLDVLQFSHSQDNYVSFVCQLPHGYKVGSDIYPHVHWSPIDTDAGNVRWLLRYSWANIGDVFPAGSNIYTTDATDLTAEKHQLVSFAAIDGTGQDISSMLHCRLYRLGTSVVDTYGSDVNCHEFDFHIQKDTVGSSEEKSK